MECKGIFFIIKNKLFGNKNFNPFYASLLQTKQNFSTSFNFKS